MYLEKINTQLINKTQVGYGLYKISANEFRQIFSSNFASEGFGLFSDFENFLVSQGLEDDKIEFLLMIISSLQFNVELRVNRKNFCIESFDQQQDCKFYIWDAFKFYKNYNSEITFMDLFSQKGIYLWLYPTGFKTPVDESVTDFYNTFFSRHKAYMISKPLSYIMIKL